MVYLEIQDKDVGALTQNTKKKIQKDGSIATQTYAERAKEKGFRPGKLSLRSIRMQWTLTDFAEMDAKYEFKVKPQKDKDCTVAYLDSKSCNSFTTFVKSRAFSPRIAFLYGTTTPDGGVRVETIYEPAQALDELEEMMLLEDPLAKTVTMVAKALGLKKVGWMFCCPAREAMEEPLSSHELLMAADQQLEACKGDVDKAAPFVTVKVQATKEGQASFEAFHASKQCMEMMLKGALQESDTNPGACAVSDTYTAHIPTKSGFKVQKSISTLMFTLTVPVKSHTCTFLEVDNFPVANRDGMGSNGISALASHLRGNSSKPHAQRIANFQVLLTVAPLFGKNDIPNLARSVLDPKTPLGEGYKLLLDNIQQITK